MSIITESQLNSGAYFSQVVYRNFIVANNYTTFASPYDRSIVAKYQEHANALTYRVAQAITSETFEGIPDEVLEEWKKWRWNSMWNSVFIEALTHGYCVLELFPNKPFWRVYSGDMLNNVELDKHGKPEQVTITYKLTSAQNEAIFQTVSTEPVTKKINGKTVFWIKYGDTPGPEGVSILQPVWSSIMDFVFTTQNMAFYDSRIGSGLLVITSDENVDVDTDNTIDGDLDYTMTNYGLKLPVGMKAELLVSNSQVNFPEHLAIHIKRMSAGSGLPERFFSGEATGTLSTSDQDSDVIQTRLKRVFGELKDEIVEVIEARWDVTIDIEEIAPKIGEALDQDEENRLMNEQGGTPPNEEKPKRGLVDKVLRRNK